MCGQPRRVDRRKCDPQARPSTSYVDNTIDLLWRNFFKSRVWDKIPEGSTFIFGDTRISWQYSVGQVEGSLYAKNQLDSSSGFDTIPASDGRSDRQIHCDSKYRASIASRGKNWMSKPPFLRLLPVAVAPSSSSGVAICYMLPVLWITSCSSIIAQAKETQTECVHIMGEVTSQSLWSRYDRHFVGQTRHNALS